MYKLACMVEKQAKPPLTLPQGVTTQAYFEQIVTTIIGQQISTAAARTIRSRVQELLPVINPDSIQAVSPTALRNCGVSERKIRYILYNAANWHTLPIAEFGTMPDEDIIPHLTKLYGIGRWTAEMFLLFTMGRPDVFAYDDLGLMQSLYSHYHYYPHYRRKIETTVHSWSPYRSVASLILWRTRDAKLYLQ